MIKKSQALSLNCKSNFAHETALFEISEMWLRSFWWIFVHRLNCTQYCTICAMINSNKSKQKKTVKCWISVSTFSSRSFVFISSFQQRLADFVQRRRNTRGHVLVCLNLVLLRILGVDLQTDLWMHYLGLLNLYKISINDCEVDLEKHTITQNHDLCFGNILK